MPLRIVMSFFWFTHSFFFRKAFCPSVVISVALIIFLTNLIVLLFPLRTKYLVTLMFDFSLKSILSKLSSCEILLCVLSDHDFIKWDVLLRKGRGEGGEYLTKFNTRRLRPEVQPLNLLYTILAEKVLLLYIFYWEKVSLSHTYFRTLSPTPF